MDDVLQILSESDGPVIDLLCRGGKSDIVLVCEHASNRFPESLGTMGLTDAARSSHIAWDPGARAVARGLSRLLDAPLVTPRFSRLVYDCNRPPHRPDAIPARSESFDVPGNADLGPAERLARMRAIYTPFRAALDGVIAERLACGRAAVLITVHSFTPVFFGQWRDIEVGILHDSDARLADACLAAGAGAPGPSLSRNKPYGPEDGVTYTLREHALPLGLPNLMFEVRNDLVADEEQQNEMAAWLAGLLERGLNRLFSKVPAS